MGRRKTVSFRFGPETRAYLLTLPAGQRSEFVEALIVESAAFMVFRMIEEDET